MRSLAAWAKAEKQRKDPEPLTSRLFPKQRAVFNDPSKRKALLCSRRAGKTDVIASKLLMALLKWPTLIVPYITLTSKVSKANLWAKIAHFNRIYNLGLREVETLGQFKHPRGGYIWLTGCKDKAEAEKFRGPYYPLVIIDEAGTFRTAVLEYLIDNVLDAALTDVDGELWLSGTPGLVPEGYFWERTTGEGELGAWPTHSWTVEDNPHHPLSKPGALEAKRVELGLSPDSPKWLREYCGKWSLDVTALIYYCDPLKNYYSHLPTVPMRTTLGIDVGYEDETAFVVCSSIWGQPHVYVRHAHGKSGMLPSDIAAEIRSLTKLYGVQEMYMDSGGLALTILKQLQVDYGLGVEPAEKTDKAGAIQRVKDGLLRGEIQLDPLETKPLVHEWNTLVWHDKHQKGHREGMPDHNADALLYAYRPHLHQRPPIKPPELTLDERLRQEQARSKARLAMGKRR